MSQFADVNIQSTAGMLLYSAVSMNTLSNVVLYTCISGALLTSVLLTVLYGSIGQKTFKIKTA